jgi:hypothetical protein
MPFLSKLRARLIPEACQWWRMLSNQLALVAGIAAAVVVAINPASLVAAYSTIVALPPGPARWGGAALAFMGFAGVPILVRLWKQGGGHDAGK